MRAEKKKQQEQIEASAPSLSFSVPKHLMLGVPVAASGSLVLGDRVRIDGTIANVGDGPTIVGVDSAAGDVWARGPVDLRDRATVDDVFASSEVAVGNEVAMGAVFPEEPASLALSVNFPAAGAHVSLEPDQERSLAPGAYGNVALKRNSRLKLEGGDYSFAGLIADAGSIIEVDSRCGSPTIVVSSTLLFRGRLESDQSDPPARFVYVGSAAAHIESPFVGEVYAPRSELVLSGHQHVGRFYGQHLRIQPGGTVAPGSITVPLPGRFCDPGASALAERFCEHGNCCAPQSQGVLVSATCSAPPEARCAVGDELSQILVSDTVTELVFGGGGADYLRANAEQSTLLGGEGDDRICAYRDGTVIYGGNGNDIIRARGAEIGILPGAGTDTISVEAGEATLITFHACELDAQDVIELAPGATLRVLSQRSRADLEAAGVRLPPTAHVEVIPQNSCESSCAGAPTCGAGEVCVEERDGSMACVATDASFSQQPIDIAVRYPNVPPSVRDELWAFIEKIQRGESFAQIAPAELRASARLLVPELRNVALEEKRSFALRLAEIEALGALYVAETVPALRDIASTGPKRSGDEELVPESLWRRGQRAAIMWLQLRARRGDPAADDALLSVARTGDSYAVEQAALAYLWVDGADARRQRLEASLPTSSAYVLNLEVQ